MLRQMLRRFSGWIDLGGTGHARYKSAKEIALENAAEVLGVSLGDYYPDDWEIPKDEIVDSSLRLTRDARARGAAAREEMFVYIDRVRRTRRRRRRRRIVLLVAVVAIAPAGFLAGGILSDADEAGDRDKASTDERPGFRFPPIEGPSPYSSSVSPAVREGSVTIANMSFVSRRGSVCATMARVRKGIAVPVAMGSCLTFADLSKRIDADRIALLGWVMGKGVMAIRGFTSDEITKITGRGPGGRLKVDLSEPWTPAAVRPGYKASRMRPVRAFVAVVRRGVKRFNAGQSNPLEELKSYSMTARLKDRRVVRFKSLQPG